MALNATGGRLVWRVVFGVAVLVAVGCVGFVLTLSRYHSQPVVNEGKRPPRVGEGSPLIERELPVIAEIAEPADAQRSSAVSIGTDERALDNRLQQIRREFKYPLNGVKVTESGLNGAISQTVVVDNPLVLLALKQWFLDDPEAFIKAAAAEERDSYLQAVLKEQINESNAHLLTEHLHIRNRHIITLSYENKLHLQEAEAFLAIFDQFAKNNVISVPASLVAATAEVDYWGRRETLLNQAVNNPEPGLYFDVLQQQGNDNMYALAEQMWAVHLADRYADDIRPDTGYLERTRLAYQYGVAGSPAAIAALQEKGLFVNETIAEFTDVDNADDRFQDIHLYLRFDRNSGHWYLP
ncbi:hypothetical protein [Reinekea sp. G2M2-21]|uniref:hypothetical protein n=1 Tax=Reinekea sp. G2M2-21 TaxID=2788942 RepID=UPI0018A9B6D1|nr:hypothetical protein [Reinekea sp. G2M2-21]